MVQAVCVRERFKALVSEQLQTVRLKRFGEGVLRYRRSLGWGGYERLHLEGGLECEADALGVNRAGEAEGGVIGEGDGLSWRTEASDGQGKA